MCFYLASTSWASYFYGHCASKYSLQGWIWEVVRDHLVRCAFLQTCAFNLASPFPREKPPPPPVCVFPGLHIKFKNGLSTVTRGEGRLFQKIPLQYRAMRLNLRRPRTAGADNERFQRPNALASSEMMATVYSRILVLAAICPYALAFTGVPPSAMSSSYAHREPCPYNMQMPRRIGRPAQGCASTGG